MKIIPPISLLLTSIVLIYYGYKSIFETDNTIQQHIKKRKIKENSFHYNLLQKNGTKHGIKITGLFFILGGITFFILAILTSLEKI